MSVPCRPGARFEAHQAGTQHCRFRRLDNRLLPNSAGETIGRTTARGPRTASINVHVSFPPYAAVDWIKPAVPDNIMENPSRYSANREPESKAVGSRPLSRLT